MLQLFSPEQPQQDPDTEEKAVTLNMQQVLLLKKAVGVLLWFVVSMNVTLFSRDSDNKNWAYTLLFLIKGANVANAISKGGREGVSQGITTSVAMIAGTIAGGF